MTWKESQTVRNEPKIVVLILDEIIKLWTESQHTAMQVV